VLQVEKALDQKEIALGIFLDIEGVFNNISYDSICSSDMRLIRPLYRDCSIQGMPIGGCCRHFYHAWLWTFW